VGRDIGGSADQLAAMQRLHHDGAPKYLSNLGESIGLAASCSLSET
jgi:hypothetical protein